MNNDNNKLVIDKLIIICGVVGLIISIAGFIFIQNGTLEYDANFPIIAAVSVAFIVFGIMQYKKDKNGLK